MTGAAENNHWKKGLMLTSKKDQQQNYRSFIYSQLTFGAKLKSSKRHEKIKFFKKKCKKFAKVGVGILIFLKENLNYLFLCTSP